MLYKYLKKISYKIIKLYFVLLFYLVSVAIFFINSLDILEYVKSFLLTSIMLFIYLNSLNKLDNNIKSINLLLVIKYSSVLIISFELFQVFEKLLYGTTNSWFFFDSISISTATSSGRFQATNFLTFTRPISIYHEPSYLGIILLILLITGKQLQIQKSFQILIISGILISFSTTALLFLILYYVLRYLKKIKIFIFIISILFFLLFTFFDSETVNNFIRINEILNSGTSGNQRLIGPYDYLAKELFTYYHIFGIPLGQSDLVFNNSFYLLFLYFGFITPFLFIFFIKYIFNIYGYNAMYYLVAIFALLFLNGAIFTMEDAFILYFLNITFNFTEQKTSILTNNKSII